MAISYSLKLALRSIWHEKWINLLSILTIAAGLLITAITLLSVYNIDVATKKLPEKFSIMLYLRENLSQQELRDIMNSSGKENFVERVKYIPKDEALKELKVSLKDAAYVLDGLGENPLPDAVEVKLKNDSISPDAVKGLTSRLKTIKGVEEVEYGERFLSSIYSLRAGMQSVGIALVIILCAGTIFVCYSTVKILFYRRSMEVETYKLLGATRGFIRGPFMIEGAVIGSFGGFLSLIGILSLYYLILLRLSLTFPLFSALIFPIDIFFVLPLAGLLLGIIGAVIAIGRIRY